MFTTATECTVPFSYFVDLVRGIAKIRPRRAAEQQTRSKRYEDIPAYNTFARWVKALRSEHPSLPPDTTAIVFRFLFPEADIQRKYALQETRLAQHVAKILGVCTEPHGRGERLKNWKGDDSMGCLGAEVEAVMSVTVDSQASATAMTLGQVDALLAELSAKCAHSEHTPHAPSPRRSRDRKDILTVLYTSLSPAECAVVTQIILKDLRPLLYPLPHSATHTWTALREYKSNAVAMLTKEAAMHAWDPSGRFKVIYRSRASLEDAARGYDQLLCGDELPQPEFGQRIEIPKCVKGQGTAQCLRTLHGAGKVWMETKYDGERAQIHVQLDSDGVSRIKIFSKSGRDSTLDRAGVHGVIYDALGLSNPHAENRIKTSSPSFETNIIVEAEMVAFSDTLNRVDEFWRIRSLIASTAIGVRHKNPPRTHGHALESQHSLASNASDEGTRHLSLVFFDILLLDGVSLLSLPYCERRSILEQIIRVIPGHAMLAARTCVDLKQPDAEDAIRAAFAKLIADREEGAVLKAGGARYVDWKLPWIKLKRDYIDGLGDGVDLVLFGAHWEKDRARELRVSPSTFTTFYFGALANGNTLTEDEKPSHRPHFEAVFTSSYGLSREQLEDLNYVIRNPTDSDPIDDTTTQLPYTYKISSTAKPSFLLQTPLLAELLGAGFTKAQGSSFYELRFPRICKVYRSSDRPWTDGVSLTDFQLIARTAVGMDRSRKEQDDWAQGLFCPGEPASPGIACPKKRKQTEAMWIDKLETVDKKTSRRVRSNKQSRVQHTEPRRSIPDTHTENEGTEAVLLTTGNGGIPRSKVGLSRLGLGSVTNLAARPPSAIGPAPFSETKVESPPRSPPLFLAAHVAVNTPTPAALAAAHVLVNPSVTPLNLRSPESDPHYEPVETLRPSIQAVKDEHASLGPAAVQGKLGGQSTSINLPETPPYTLYHYLRDSVVWLAQPVGSSRPSWRAPSRAVIPPGNQVHTLDAALLACGWGPGSGQSCSWSSRGVIFVDDSEEGGRGPMDRTLRELVARRRELLATDKAGGCKPVFVLSMKMLAYDALNANVTREELEARAICRFG